MSKTELGAIAEDSAVRHIKVCCPLLKELTSSLIWNVNISLWHLYPHQRGQKREIRGQGRLLADTPRH